MIVFAALAALVTTVGQLAGWHGVDTAAAVYRADSFRRHGLALWDSGWYGGHWNFDYSVLYPAVAGTLGVALTAVLSAAVASGAFAVVARRHLGRGGVAAAGTFAIGTLVPASIGQLPFLAGAAAALAAVAVGAPLDRQERPGGRWRVAGVAASSLLCALLSPLAAGFLMLAAATVALTRRRADPWVVAACSAAVPVAGCAVLFPGQGPMPYPVVDWLWEAVVALGLAGLAGRRWAAVRVGSLLFVAAASLAVLLPSPLGGNIGRIEDLVALPLAVGMGGSRLAARRPSVLLRLAPVAVLISIPLALSEWAPAWGAIASAPALPSTRQAYFLPLDTALRQAEGPVPPGRVEVVPTQYHWEAAWVAPVVPLARGWERQLDVADNPLFYRPGPIEPPAYRRWLLGAGVRFVALADAPLDPAGVAEAALIRSGRASYLRLVWRSAHWTLYGVTGSRGIVSGPAVLTASNGGKVTLAVARPGRLVVRVRFAAGWRVTEGAARLERTGGGWLAVEAPYPELLTVAMTIP